MHETVQFITVLFLTAAFSTGSHWDLPLTVAAGHSYLVLLKPILVVIHIYHLDYFTQQTL